MIIQKKGFTLVELIVVITILAILGTIAFISLQGYSNSANRSKVLYDIRLLNSSMEINLWKWVLLENLVLNNKKIINWVNTWTTIDAWKYILWNLTYEVWTFDYKKLRENWSNYLYNDSGELKEFIFWYVRTPKKLYYEFAWQVKNDAWDYEVLISWNYYETSETDALWLISESSSTLWLQNWYTLTWSLY